jgi:hypothetical protein
MFEEIDLGSVLAWSVRCITYFNDVHVGRVLGFKG